MKPPSSTQWTGVWLSFLAGVVAAISVTKASPALLVVRQEFELSTVQVGWIMSSVAIGTIVLGIYTGSLARQHGAKKLIQLALALIFIASSFGFLIDTANQLLASRIIEGIGIIFISVSAPTLIARLSKPSDMGLTMGVWALWMPVGSILIFLLSPIILQHLGWQSLWASTALISLPLIFLLKQIPDTEHHTVVENNENIATFNKISVISLASVFICFTGIFFSFITYLPSYLVNTYSLSNNSALFVTTLLPALIIPGNLLSGFFIHKGLSPTQMIAYPATLIAITISLMFNLSHTVSSGLILLACFGLFLGMIPTGIFAQAPRIASKPSEIGHIMGILVTGQGFGILFAPPLAGYLIGEQQLWNNIYPLLMLFATLIVVFSQIVNRLSTPSR